MRQKRPHLLAALSRLNFPHRFVFFDSESSVPEIGKPVNRIKPHTPRLMVAELWESTEPDRLSHTLTEERVYKGAPWELCDKFYRWLDDIASNRAEGRRGSICVIAANVGYDVQATGGAPRLIELGWKPAAPYAKGPVYIWRFTKNKRTIAFLSSTNHFLATVAQLGETFNLPKLDTDTQTRSMRKLLEYCKRDVAIVRTAYLYLVSFLRGDGSPRGPIGPWGDTISSVAFKAFRFGFMGHEIQLHTHPEAEAIERAAYCGGRVQVELCGRPAPLPLHYLDVTSLYPFVMLDGEFPVRLLGVRGECSPEELRSVVETGGLIIAQVEVSIERPCLPYKGDKLLFPVGRYVTTLCAPELALAFRLGTVHRVLRSALYEGGAIFTDYIAHMHKERSKAQEKGAEALSLLFKYLMNNLYGKFGQTREEWLIMGTAPIAAVGAETLVREDGTSFERKTFGGFIWEAQSKAEAFNSFPAVAAFVTSYARAHLWALMNIAGNLDPAIAEGPAGRQWIYCDTDSLFVTQIGYERLLEAGQIAPRTLGKLKLEKTATERAIFYGAKAYEFDGFIKRKGIPARASPIWADGSPVLTAEGRPAVAYDYWPRLLTWLREGKLDGFENRPIIKKSEVEYDKGEIGLDGWTRPRRLALESEEAPAPTLR